MFTVGLNLIVADAVLWSKRNDYFVFVPLPPVVQIPSRLEALWVAGRWAALSILHRGGIGPVPLSPFLLLLAILGPEGLDLSFLAVKHFDPVLACTLLPWFHLTPETIIENIPASPAGQLLLHAEIPYVRLEPPP
jgi:hypothetical protein